MEWHLLFQKNGQGILTFVAKLSNVFARTLPFLAHTYGLVSEAQPIMKLFTFGFLL